MHVPVGQECVHVWCVYVLVRVWQNNLNGQASCIQTSEVHTPTHAQAIHRADLHAQGPDLSAGAPDELSSSKQSRLTLL